MLGPSSSSIRSFVTTIFNKNKNRINLDSVLLSGLVLSFGAVLIEACTRTELRDAQTASECRYPPLSAILCESHVRELERNGMVIIQNILSDRQLRRANVHVRKCPAIQNSMELSDNDIDVRQDRICFVRETAIDDNRTVGDNIEDDREDNNNKNDDDMVHCIKLLRGIPFLLHRFEYSVSSAHVVPRQCQLSRYSADGVSEYVRHLDRCTSTLAEMGLLGWLRASDYRYRTVTAILYLNSPTWGDDDNIAEGGDGSGGGNLRCYPNLPSHQEGEKEHKVQAGSVEQGTPAYNNTVASVDVVPKGGTLVLFDSSRVEHQVIPPTKGQEDRYALTCFINGAML